MPQPLRAARLAIPSRSPRPPPGNRQHRHLPAAPPDLSPLNPPHASRPLVAGRDDVASGRGARMTWPAEKRWAGPRQEAGLGTARGGPAPREGAGLRPLAAAAGEGRAVPGAGRKAPRRELPLAGLCPSSPLFQGPICRPSLGPSQLCSSWHPQRFVHAGV